MVVIMRNIIFEQALTSLLSLAYGPLDSFNCGRLLICVVHTLIQNSRRINLLWKYF
jgi:hypothetical protein